MPGTKYFQSQSDVIFWDSASLYKGKIITSTSNLQMYYLLPLSLQHTQCDKEKNVHNRILYL